MQWVAWCVSYIYTYTICQIVEDSLKSLVPFVLEEQCSSFVL